MLPILICVRTEEIHRSPSSVNCTAMDPILERIKKGRRRRRAIVTQVSEHVRNILFAASTRLIQLREEETEVGTWGGRVKGVKNFKRGKSTWAREYLTTDSTYPDRLLRRRFGVPRELFFRIHRDLLELRPEVWEKRRSASGLGHPSEVKVLVCLRLLRTGDSYDMMDDGAKMSEESTRMYFRQFIRDMIEIYGGMYLNRRPTKEELKCIEDDYNEVGFAGCGGSIDCMKLIWKNCPFSEKGQYHNGKEGKMATIVVEAWCDRDLYIWSWFAGRAGTNNDLNVLAVSPLIQSILRGDYLFRLEEGFKLTEKGPERTQLYLLGDGIYPNWPLFAKPIHQPTDEGQKCYTKRQEAIRKDIERCFGVMQARFEIIRRENRRWDKNEVVMISEVCSILHNMIIRMVRLGEVVCEDGTDIVQDLYNEEVELEATIREESRDIRDSNSHVPDGRDGTQSQVEGHAGSFSAIMEEIMVREYQLTSRGAFRALQEELIERFS